MALNERERLAEIKSEQIKKEQNKKLTQAEINLNHKIQESLQKLNNLTKREPVLRPEQTKTMLLNKALINNNENLRKTIQKTKDNTTLYNALIFVKALDVLRNKGNLLAESKEEEKLLAHLEHKHHKKHEDKVHQQEDEEEEETPKEGYLAKFFNNIAEGSHLAPHIKINLAESHGRDDLAREIQKEFKEDKAVDNILKNAKLPELKMTGSRDAKLEEEKKQAKYPGSEQQKQQQNQQVQSGSGIPNPRATPQLKPYKQEK